ncbi:MAG: RNA polymerase sigma factor RpoD/SigA [Bacteroidia bacterium]|nr:RNA polymerase sigma factor RpoD/SigA [Bacteroidia bacterium]
MRQLKISRQITNRDNASLEMYLHDIAKIPMITADEEVELASRIKKGDKSALERLVMANLRFVVSVAKQYQNQGLSLPDLINEGNLGLIKAAERFDETRGFKFISYAVWWIRQAILQAIAEQSRIVRLPLNKIGVINKIYQHSAAFEQMNEREPTLEEICEAMDLLPSEAKELIRNSPKPVSMDAPLTDGEDAGNMYDLLENMEAMKPDSEVMNESLRKDIDFILANLDKREADVVRLYFGLNGGRALTLDEISEKFHLTRERVRQIKDRAVKRIRTNPKVKRLKIYLG